MVDDGKITIKCDACGKGFKAPSKLSGQKARCPCGQVLDVPSQMSSDGDIPTDGEWYYLAEGERKGPIAQEELENLIQEGSVCEDVRVWKRELDAWQPATEVKSLCAGLRADEAPASEGQPQDSGEVDASSGGGGMGEREEQAEDEAQTETEIGEEASPEDRILKPPGTAPNSRQQPTTGPQESRLTGESPPRAAADKSLEIRQLIVVRVISWALMSVGGVGLLGALGLSIIGLFGTGVSVVSESTGVLMMGAVGALVAGAILWVAWSIARGVWRVARLLEDQ